MKKTNISLVQNSARQGWTDFFCSSLFYIILMGFFLLPVFSIAGDGDEVRLNASDADKKDGFGSSVSISGDYVIIGSPLDDKNSGSVYVFKHEGSEWIEQSKLTASDADKKDRFGSSVSISGNYVIIGSPSDDKDSGSAYVFRYDGSEWTEQTKLTASDASKKESFGSSVSISGDYVIIGSPSDDKDSGSAYVFRYDGSKWTEQTKLTASDADKKDKFGSSVSISGDYVIIGSPSDDKKSGSAYVFKHEGSEWTEQVKLTASDADKKDGFGSSVFACGNYVIIGSPSDDKNSGFAYVFKYDGSKWSEKVKLTASDADKKDGFGSSVSACGNYVIAGSPSDNKKSGSAYLYATIRDLNEAPVAVFTADPTEEHVPFTVTFDASSSFDADGSIVDYQWDFDSDGISDATGMDVSRSFVEPGSYEISLTVVDNNDAASKAVLTIIALENPPPDLTINYPEDGSIIHESKPVITITYHDNESGVDLDTFKANLNGVDVTNKFDVTETSATLYPEIDLPPGENAITVNISDTAGYTATASSIFTYEDITAPEILITSPLNGTTVTQPSINVIGTVDDKNAVVTVNNTACSVDNGVFTAVDIPLSQGPNTITALAIDPSGNQGEDTINITYEPDTNEPPAIVDPTFDSELKITASDGAANECFGYSVATSGDYIIVGKIKENGYKLGSAYIFKYDGAEWVEQKKLIASDAAASDYFGYSVSINGEHAIVGAYGNDENGSNAGAAYIFKYNGSEWIEQKKLLASDAAASDYFGRSVSINGEYAIIGAYGNDENGSYSGAAYIFKYNGSEWIEQKKLFASDAAAYDRFGLSVSINGEYAIIGAYGNDENGSNAGAAYIFKYNGSEWIEQKKLIASDTTFMQKFGISVALNSDYAVIGADGDNGKGLYTGAVYVYKNAGPIPPVASFTAIPAVGELVNSSSTIVFDASSSYDPDGIITDYQWDFDSNGEADANSVEASHTFTSPGNYEVTLTVTDDQGKTGTVSKTIIVYGNTPPALSINYPADGSIILNPGPIITVYYSDNESGIDLNSFKALLNGMDVSNRFSLMENIATMEFPMDRTMGVNTLEVRISDLAGNTKTAQSTFSVPRIIITSPFDNEIITLPYANVTGLITDGASEAYIMVNDYYQAQVNGNSFFANNIPLSAGENEITVTVTEPDGTTDSTSITVTVDVDYTSEWIDLTLSPESGIAPLEVNLSADLHLAGQVQSSRIEYDGPGSIVATFISDTEYNLLFETPGVYTVTYIVTDDSGVEHEQTRLVNVIDREYLNGLLKEKWYGMTQALQNGNIAAALKFFATDAQQTYSEQFNILAPVLNDIAAEFNTAELVLRDVIANTARYYLLITRQGVDRAFTVYFIKDEDGSWKIWRF